MRRWGGLLVALLVVSVPADGQRTAVTISTVANLPSPCTAGQPWIVTDGAAPDDCSTGGGAIQHWCICNSAGTGYDSQPYSEPKCMVIETPADADNFLFFRAEVALNIVGIDCLVNAATSAVATVQECNANGASCSAVEAAMTCGTTNTTESGGIDNSTIDAGDWLRVDVGTVTGSPGHLAVCVYY